jgi:RNA polymerase sigma-70 factor, ECF subfamily
VAVEELGLSIAARRMVREEAFTDLMRRHERLVLRTAWRMMGSIEDGQDAAQEVFLKLFKHFEDLDQVRGVEPWLYRITMNVCYDLLRKRRTQVADLPELPASAEQHNVLEADERRKLLAAALLTLPPKERAAIVLRDIEGLDTKEVADILGSSEVTVRSQISMGRSKLKLRLQGVR